MLPLSPRSDRAVKRLAMAIAFENLSSSDQSDRLSEAREIIEHLRGIA